ncbi:MAG: DUF4906 domain-containing protein [Alistipes sp.]|nr:DUF4906 domain-containing protein [Alistipes sp.]
MRNIYKYLLIAVAIAAVGLASCMYDDGIDNVRIVEGRPAQVELTFAVENNVEVTTRAAQDEMYEHLVQNIYVFVFNGNQRVTTDKSFFDSSEITNYYNKVVNGNEQSHGTITFGALSGSGLTVCAIANINISNTNVTRADIGEETQVDLAKLDAITTYSELQNMSIRLNSGNINRGASFMMTGEVPATLEADKTTEVEIPLKRADSKITFNVTAENSKYDDFTFIPNSFRVVNAPLKSYILPRVTTGGATLTADMDAATDVTKDFYSISESQAPKFEVVGDNSGSFTFYMYENLKKPKALINKHDNEGYALREKENKGEDGRNTSYIYAPDNATYVVLTGELSYSFEEPYEDPVTGTQSKITKWLMADVEYVVHLGHSGVANVDDYSTLRNHHYTYNVTIKGVNDLIVEVDNDNDPEKDDQDNEQRPGAEGEIVMSAQRVINVDGHYDRANIQLTDTEAKELHFAINTPWESGYDTNGFNTQNNSTVRDYKWVKFLINKEVGVAQNANTFAAYPGDQCYDGGKTDTGTAATSTAYNRTVTLRDIRQLSNYLKNDTNRANAMSTDGKIYITVFIDEYLYFYDPTADPMSTPAQTNYKGVTTADAAGLLLWKKSVNQPDRMLHIVKAGEMKYSDDYETSISRSVVTIKQRSIQTFYNVNAESLTSAWGTETINETPRMTPANNKTIPNAAVNDNDYVRAQKLTSNGTPDWDAVISSTQQYGFGTNYNDPIYACAMRNRDFNGDGKINQQEVQWYLTSLNQMSDLWVGEPCMPSYARLFHLDDESGYDGIYDHHSNGDTKGRHYITSYWKSTNNPTSRKLYVYWAEEYGANCAFDTSLGSWYGSPQSGGKHVVSVRCVRNLGMAYTSTSMPTDYLQVVDSTPNNATDNEVSIDLSYMNIAALRQTIAATGHLPYVDMNAVGENNRPYFGFIVMPGHYGSRGGSTTQTSNQGNPTNWYASYQGEQVGGTSICPDGYRIPTQREMLIMVKALPDASWTYRYSGSNAGGYLMFNGLTTQAGNFGTFYYNHAGGEINMRTNNNMTSTTSVAMTRCVKDNPNAKHSSSSDYEDGGEG